MAYTSVRSMRSNRYPLSGLGCGCASSSPVLSGLGLEVESAAYGFTVATAGLVGVGIGWWLGKRFGRKAQTIYVNRRHRRR